MRPLDCTPTMMTGASSQLNRWPAPTAFCVPGCQAVSPEVAQFGRWSGLAWVRLEGVKQIGDLKHCIAFANASGGGVQ